MRGSLGILCLFLVLAVGCVTQPSRPTPGVDGPESGRAQTSLMTLLQRARDAAGDHPAANAAGTPKPPVPPAPPEPPVPAETLELC